MAAPFTIETTPDGKYIELGGGKTPVLRPNLDIEPGPTVDICHDLNIMPWPLTSDYYDVVVSRNLIEHFEWRKSPDFIKEILRILKPGGKTIIFTTNLYERCKLVVETGVDKAANENIYGSQEFSNFAGAHKSGYSDVYIKKLFEDAGFKNITIIPNPSSKYDLVLEAYKMAEKKDDYFEREYFESGTTGYHGYRDFATHYDTAMVIESIEPKVKSVLDVGAARGFVVRILENHGIKSVAMDVSNYCQKTRATDSFVLHDAKDIPWPFNDKEFDVVFSCNFLEHMHEENIEPVIREMMRVSNRGLHGIHTTDPPFPELDADRDKSHHSMHEKKWWEEKFHSINPEYTVVVENPRLIEYSKPEQQPPISFCPASPDKLVKLNLGSFLDCFYYGWMNCDILDLSSFCSSQAYLFTQLDLSRQFPWKDGEVDIIFSSHLLEHFDRNEGFSFLKECYRVMKPGGIIRISVPNARLLASQYVSNTIREHRFINVGVERAKDEAEAFYEVLLAHHKTIYDPHALLGMLESVGFKDILKVSAFESRSDTIRTQTVNTYPDLSLIMEAVK